jgi:predicted ester cyclase
MSSLFGEDMAEKVKWALETIIQKQPLQIWSGYDESLENNFSACFPNASFNVENVII